MNLKEAGSKIGDYTVERLLGEGATATVYLARDTKLGRRVAIKVLKENLPQSSFERFEREVSIIKEVHHRGMVKVYKAGMDGNSPYYAMEYLQGKTLREVLDGIKEGQTRKLEHQEILSIWRQLAEALGALHATKILHRDLKPSNVMIVSPLRVVLIDFGLAQLGDQMEMSEKSRGLGTQAYMSPEQLEGSLIDARSDVFSLGLIMHETVSLAVIGGRSGVPPWFGKKKHQDPWRPPLPTSYDRSLPVAMEEAVLKCLETDQLARCKNTDELMKLLTVPALERVLALDQLPQKRITDPASGPGMGTRPGSHGTGKAPTLAGAAPPAEALKNLKNYDIVGLLGQGAMGEVYRARQKDLDRQVAIKVMKAAFAGDDNLKVRFRRELEALAELQHPRIVTVYDVDFSGDVPFYVMELVEANSLTKVIEQRGILPVDEALLIFSDLVDALDACHQRGLLHRDIKPENLLVEPDGHAKLTDFGLVKFRDRTTITMDDEMIGTPSYMSPEMVSGDEVDTRSDLYQAGLVLFEMLTAKRATTGQTLDQIWEVILKKAPTNVKFFNPDCPPGLATLVQNLVEKKSADRYQTVEEIRADIAAVRSGKEVKRTKGRALQPPPAPVKAASSGAGLGLQKASGPLKVAAAPVGGKPAAPAKPGPRPASAPAVRTAPPPPQGMPMRMRVDLGILMGSAVVVGSMLAKNFMAVQANGEESTPLGMGFKLALAAFAGALVDLVISLGMSAMKTSTAVVVRQSVQVENRLNVPVRLDITSPGSVKSIERVEARQTKVLDLERGSSLLIRKDRGTAVIKSATVTPGLAVVLDEEPPRPGQRQA